MSFSAARVNSASLPVPKGNSLYALAKRAEYIEKDIRKAKSLYEQAILSLDRTESAIKDLASILHQEGNTQAACDLLMRHSDLFTDQGRFTNLLTNLQEKLHPQGNSLNKQIKVFPLAESDNHAAVKSMFRDPSRILSVEFQGKSAILTFNSHSSARKTVSSFSKWSIYEVEWVNVRGEVVGSAGYRKRRKNAVLLEPERASSADTETAIRLLGRELFAEVSWGDMLNVRAPPFAPSVQRCE